MADPRTFQGYDDLFFPQLEAYLLEDQDRAKDFLTKCKEDELEIAAYAFEEMACTFGKEFVLWLNDLCSGKVLTDYTMEMLESAKSICGINE